MSQQMMPNVSLGGVEERDVGDLEYLARIAFGDLAGASLKHFLDEDSAAATKVIATVPAGKDWYLMGWSVTLDNAATLIDLQFPTGNVVDKTKSGASTELNYIGIAKGDKATPGQTISRTLAGAANGNALNLFVLEVDTGTSPKLPS